MKKYYIWKDEKKIKFDARNYRIVDYMFEKPLKPLKPLNYEHLTFIPPITHLLGRKRLLRRMASRRCENYRYDYR